MKKLFLGLAIVVALVVGMLLFLSYRDTRDPYVQGGDHTVPTEEIPKFTEMELPFEQRFDEATDHPLTAGAMIDVDGDGVDELFLGGGVNQADVLYRYTDTGFEDITASAKLDASTKMNTLGAVSFDLDEDGHTDLLVTRSDGVYLLRNLAGTFETIRLPIEPNEKSTPGTLTVGDFDRDGDADLFLSTYLKIELMEGETIFNQHGYGSNSLLLRNDGDLRFTDVTEELGLTYTHNTFQAVFVDVDADGWLDLVVAYDTGEVRTYKNHDGRSFTVEPNPLSGKFAYPMGIAVGDFDNDTRVDFFFSNTGSTVPRFLAEGDLREDQVLVTDWLLFRNDGDFRFTDVAHEAKVADFEFSWGALFEDFSLDGRQDLAVAENYIAFPAHKVFRLPCRFLVQRPNGTFAAVEEQAGTVNESFAVTPLSSDFNGDGYPDLVYVNLGGKSRVFLSRGGENHYLKVRFPETARFVGARAELTTLAGGTLSDVYVIGEGLGSDSTPTVTFGLGRAERATRLRLIYLDGSVESLENPAGDRTYRAGGLNIASSDAEAQ